jgi:hypothetical protein
LIKLLINDLSRLVNLYFRALYVGKDMENNRNFQIICLFFLFEVKKRYRKVRVFN